MKKKVMENVMVFMLAVVMVFSSTVVYADSGKSAYTTVDENHWNKYVYSVIAPKNQTSYKKIYNTSVTVKEIKRQHKGIRTDMGKIGNTCTILGVIGLKYSIVGVVATVTSAGTFVISCGDKKYIEKSLSGLKKNTKIHNTVYFKWTNANKLKYSVKMTTYMTYKGKTIKNSKKTVYKTGSYAWGSN